MRLKLRESKTNGKLYVLYPMTNKWYKVSAIFTNINDTNAFLNEHEETSVLFIYYNAIIIADINDEGIDEI